MTNIFVYGSLKRGQGNNYMIQGADFLGTAVTLEPFDILNFGAIPGIIDGGRFRIQGEVWSVEKETLAAVDFLESNGTLYTRREIPVEFVAKTGRTTAWIYVMDRNDYQDVAVWTSNGWMVAQ